MGVGKFAHLVVADRMYALVVLAGFINEEKHITWFRLLELKCNKFMKLHPFARQSERIRSNSSSFVRQFCTFLSYIEYLTVLFPSITNAYISDVKQQLLSSQ